MKYPRQYANTTRRSRIMPRSAFSADNVKRTVPFGVAIIEQMEKAAEKFGY